VTVRFDSVLFLCVANSARSQMAEALARHVFGEAVRAQSAGSAPSRVNSYAVRALEELGVDTSGLSSKHVDTIDPASVDLVVTLCAEESCPLFLAAAPRESWAMPDPDRKHEDLTDDQRLQHFRVARDAILGRLRELARRREAGDA
jgi:arsenate reductase